jgi:hypothetical protein
MLKSSILLFLVFGATTLRSASNNELQVLHTPHVGEATFALVTEGSAKVVSVPGIHNTSNGTVLLGNFHRVFNNLVFKTSEGKGLVLGRIPTEPGPERTLQDRVIGPFRQRSSKLEWIIAQPELREIPDAAGAYWLNFTSEQLSRLESCEVLLPKTAL